MCTPNCISARQSPESINSWNPSIQLIHCRLHRSFPKKRASWVSVHMALAASWLSPICLPALLPGVGKPSGAWRPLLYPCGLLTHIMKCSGCTTSRKAPLLQSSDWHLHKVLLISRGGVGAGTAFYLFTCSCFSEGQVPPSLVKFCL